MLQWEHHTFYLKQLKKKQLGWKGGAPCHRLCFPITNLDQNKPVAIITNCSSIAVFQRIKVIILKVQQHIVAICRCPLNGVKIISFNSPKILSPKILRFNHIFCDLLWIKFKRFHFHFFFAISRFCTILGVMETQQQQQKQGPSLSYDEVSALLCELEGFALKISSAQPVLPLQRSYRLHWTASVCRFTNTAPVLLWPAAPVLLRPAAPLRSYMLRKREHEMDIGTKYLFDNYFFIHLLVLLQTWFIPHLQKSWCRIKRNTPPFTRIALFLHYIPNPVLSRSMTPRCKGRKLKYGDQLHPG